MKLHVSANAVNAANAMSVADVNHTGHSTSTSSPATHRLSAQWTLLCNTGPRAVGLRLDAVRFRDGARASQFEARYVAHAELTDTGTAPQRRLNLVPCVVKRVTSGFRTLKY